MSSKDRSTSRGRDLHSTGRGGAGNIRSASRDPVGPGPEDVSDTRGREPVSARDPTLLQSTGRGGAGNIRSPSRGAKSPERPEHEYDRELIATIDQANDTGVHSSGRGGLGNITKSPSPHPAAGGVEEEERAAHPHKEHGIGALFHHHKEHKEHKEEHKEEPELAVGAPPALPAHFNM
ncbi:hypothetical protein BV25DRAFT_1833215 [Artomyces pyxidatus]|uniref:Uncharacterized protein n=1 Tax=Artomyces pyxidatus TaxID=48021 RepID=A0ACB8SHV9_9AGAM|nr:hypothetical protein BV25DRAFT_1833215 [Artomyces pyxidatus]